MVLFEHAGHGNTQETVRIALAAAREKEIGQIVVASCGGETADLFTGKGADIVCVTHADGFVTPGENEMPGEVRLKLTQAGVQVLTTAHVLSGAERGISRRFGGAYPVEIIAHTLRMMGQGVKVCVEVAVMALDAGLVTYGRPVIAVGGTGRGADTAVVLTPAHANAIFDTRIHEILCKPGLL